MSPAADNINSVDGYEHFPTKVVKDALKTLDNLLQRAPVRKVSPCAAAERKRAALSTSVVQNNNKKRGAPTDNTSHNDVGEMVIMNLYRIRRVPFTHVTLKLCAHVR